MLRGNGDLAYRKLLSLGKRGDPAYLLLGISPLYTHVRYKWAFESLALPRQGKSRVASAHGPVVGGLAD